MGENIVAWADEEGRVCVAEAYCPHLGSNLGPAAGGRIRNGQLVCPFHGYEYDATGQCVATLYADPPKTARLRVFETQDVAGLIFAWWGIEGRGPQWDLHPDPPDNDGWCSHAIRTIRFPGHPQETTENSVDLAHFRYVHGYGSVERVGKMVVDGAYLESRFNFRSVRRFAKIAKFSLDISANILVSGLGYSFVDISERCIGMDMRLWVLATPVDGTLIDMSLVSQVREIRSPRRTWVSPAEAARPHHQQVHRSHPTPGRSPGRGDLEPQTLLVAPAPLPCRRRDHALSDLLRPVLSPSIGIGVDYTIHIIYRYREEYAKVREPERAAI